MQFLKFFVFVFFVMILGACTGKSSSATSLKTNSSSATNDETSTSPLMDTGKLKKDLNDIITSVTSGNPDTTKLKNAAGDIMQTDASILSDSGIDKMYGNSNDPSVKAAGNMLKKMRNASGLTPDKLDSIKKAAAELQQGTLH